MTTDNYANDKVVLSGGLTPPTEPPEVFTINNSNSPGILKVAFKDYESTIRKDEREKVLKELGEMLNSRIAKMEILNSNKPSHFRKGIIEGYKDIERWERSPQRLNPGIVGAKVPRNTLSDKKELNL